MSAALKTTAAIAVGVAALAGCTPGDAQRSDSSGEDVVITTSMNRSGEQEAHYAECGPDPTADTGEYQVVIAPGQDYGGLPEGAPCPDGEREPMPADENPELYAEMSDTIQAPAPYEGGDINTCGVWEADDPADARVMLAECGPLTKGELP